jgi:Rhodopirellula transposase DDE domain
MPRLFSQISSNWAGKPLRTLEIMLGYIRGTTTTTGLKVTASLDDAHYKKRQKVTQKDFAELLVSPHNVCPSWNYTIRPRQ